MAQKFFGFGSRPNTPVSQAKPAAEQNWYEPPENSPTHCLHTQPKPHVFARMASYLNLRGASQPPLAPMWNVEKSKQFNVENFIQESDRIWHNPSLLQMVETVGCCMMKNGIAETIPKNLNSYVACMVEQYRWMHHQTKQCKTAFKELEQLREKERKEFKDMSDEWKQREHKFKSEIKRLELQIMESNPGNGMEKVLLNRQSSVVNRNDTKRFSARLDRLSGADNEAAKNEAKNENQKLNPANVALTTTTNAYRTLGNVPRLMDHNNDVYLSDKLRQQQFTGRYQPPLGRVRIDNPRYFNTEALQRAAARATPPQSVRQSPLRQVTTAVQEPQPRKKSGSSSSSTSSSARSSVSLITAGLAEEAARRGISPPSGVDSIEKHRLDANIAMKALKEQLKTKAMPECAIEDDDNDTPDIQQKPEHHRTRSFDSGDDKNFSASKIPMITVQEYKEAVLETPKHTEAQSTGLPAAGRDPDPENTEQAGPTTPAADASKRRGSFSSTPITIVHMPFSEKVPSQKTQIQSPLQAKKAAGASKTHVDGQLQLKDGARQETKLQAPDATTTPPKQTSVSGGDNVKTTTVCDECKKQLDSGKDDSTKSSPGSAAFHRVQQQGKAATGNAAMVAASAAVLLFNEREPTGYGEELRREARRSMLTRRRKQ